MTKDELKAVVMLVQYLKNSNNITNEELLIVLEKIESKLDVVI